MKPLSTILIACAAITLGVTSPAQGSQRPARHSSMPALQIPVWWAYVWVPVGFFMAGAHVAHDCIVGSNVIFANNATLGGHVVIGDHVFLGGLCAIHQFCRIGSYAFIGGCAAVPTDVIPYASATGNHAQLSGLNIVGMKRRGMQRAARPWHGSQARARTTLCCVAASV